MTTDLALKFEKLLAKMEHGVSYMVYDTRNNAQKYLMTKVEILHYVNNWDKAKSNTRIIFMKYCNDIWKQVDKK